jgi:hypothetical protein
MTVSKVSQERLGTGRKLTRAEVYCIMLLVRHGILRFELNF